MTLPNFLVIGAAKAGTTSLYRYLSQHPQIFVSPVKEPKFFALEGQKVDFRGPGDGDHEYITSYDTYTSLFDSATGEIAIGEASPWYLQMPDSAGNIHRHLPDVKLVVILRDPVERAYSQYCMHLRDGHEPIADFELAWQAEPKRRSENWSPRWFYRDRGFYYLQLKRYFDLFDKKQIRIYLFEDLESDSVTVVQDIYAFLGVDKHFVPDTSRRFNIRRTPATPGFYQTVRRSGRVRSVAKRLARNRTYSKLANIVKRTSLYRGDPLSSAMRQRLVEEYRHDISRLSRLINRDLSEWLKC